MEIAKKQKKSRKEEPRNELIVQHNHLIEAKYKLTLQEKRLMCWLASQVKQTDEDFKEHTLSIKEFSILVDSSGNALHKTLEAVTHKLMQKIITIRVLGGKGFTKAALLGGAKYLEGDALLKLSFHPYLKPYMLQLKEKFTTISLGDVLGLKSIHAIRLYELLKQYASIGNRAFSLIDLREYFGISEAQYKKFNNFKKDVLERSKREINSKTDILIDYEEIKTSRRVTSIRFNIKENPNYGKTHFEKAQSEKATILAKELRSTVAILEQLLEYGFNKQAAKRLVKNHEEANIINAIKAVEIYRSKHDVKNARALVETAIKEKWHPEKYVAKKK